MNYKPSYEELEAQVIALYHENVSLKNKVSDLEQDLKNKTPKSMTDKRKRENFFMFMSPCIDKFNTLLDSDKKSAIKLFMYMVRKASKAGSVVESMRNMAGENNLSTNTVNRALKELVEEDLIKVGKVGRQNVYAVNPMYATKISQDSAHLTAYNVMVAMEKGGDIAGEFKASITLDTIVKNPDDLFEA